MADLWKDGEREGVMRPEPGTDWRVDWLDGRDYWRITASHFWVKRTRETSVVTFWASEGGECVAVIPLNLIRAIRRMEGDLALVPWSLATDVAAFIVKLRADPGTVRWPGTDPEGFTLNQDDSNLAHVFADELERLLATRP